MLKEYYYHPLVYKTIQCERMNVCRREECPNFHSEADRRYFSLFFNIIRIITENLEFNIFKIVTYNRIVKNTFKLPIISNTR